jgi:single-strand DNA-binding protein
MNRCIFIGRLTRPPEMRFSPSGVAVTNFTLAVGRQFKSQDGTKQTDFIDCVAFRGLAEVCANYLAKGREAAVEGRLEIQNYETQDGQKRKAARIICDNVQFIGSKDSAAPRGEQPQPQEEFGAEVGTEVFGEEIPF